MTAPSPRQHHIDALRGFAMLLGIALHVALAFGGTPWIVTDSSRDEFYRWFFEAVHGFRMHLFFFVSGYFTMLLWRRRGLSALLEQRFQRVTVPLLLGFVTVVPLLQWVAVRAGDTAPASGAAVAAGKSALVEAIRKRDAAEVSRLIATDTDPNAADPEFGLPPLGWAALHGDATVARLLLDGGADANGKDRDGYRPLHQAAFLGHPAVVELLLERGADAGAVGKSNDTARDSAAADWGATRFIAGLLRVPLRTEKETRDGRAECVAAIDRHVESRGGSGLLAAARGQLKSARDDYRDLLTSPAWALRMNPQGPPLHLIFANQFSHLWFLWFLCWFVVLFALVALPAEYLPLPRLPGGLVLSRFRLLWLVPLTLVPQLLMNVFGAGLGPDTATGVLPQPHLLAFYGLFFFAGAVYHDADDRDGRFGRWWGLWLPLAGGAFYLAKDTLGDPLVSGVLQVTFAWAMTLALFGLFRRLLGREVRAARYLSDSAYWLYLVHLPLVVFAQAWVREWPYPAWQKFLGITVGVTAVLLLAYQLLVRHTYLGRLLNGPRANKPARPAPPDPMTPDPRPASVVGGALPSVAG